MPVRTSAWPIEAFPFEEILTPVVESFLDFEEGRAFDWSRSAIRQLHDRVGELGTLPSKDALLAHVCGFLVGGYPETRMKSGVRLVFPHYHRGT